LLFLNDAKRNAAALEAATAASRSRSPRPRGSPDAHQPNDCGSPFISKALRASLPAACPAGPKVTGLRPPGTPRQTGCGHCSGPLKWKKSPAYAPGSAAGPGRTATLRQEAFQSASPARAARNTKGARNNGRGAARLSCAILAHRHEQLVDKGKRVGISWKLQAIPCLTVKTKTPEDSATVQ